MPGVKTVAVVAMLLLSSGGHAHVEGTRADAPGAMWSFDYAVVIALILSAVFYAVGVARLWRRAGRGRGLSAGQLGVFIAGWLSLVVALVSPLDTLGERFFAAHMAQHEALMLVAAPLLVISRPLAAWTWALPHAWRRAAGRATRQTQFASVWALLTAPLSAWVLHALALWAWHAPALFDAALLGETTHAWQHLSFLAAALLFWWTILGRDPRRTHGGALLSLLTTMIHTGLLGALLTFAPSVWYEPYLRYAQATGMDALSDQQLGGLIMWVPAGTVYLLVALILVWRRITADSPNTPQQA